MSVEIIITLIGIVLGSNWLGQFLMEVYRAKSKKKTPSEIILKALSRSHLLQRADYYHELGYIPKDEYDDIYEEFEAYSDLKGNGRVLREYDKKEGLLKDLPVK